MPLLATAEEAQLFGVVSAAVSRKVYRTLPRGCC